MGIVIADRKIATRPVRVGMAQHRCTDNLTENHDRAEQAVRDLAAQGAQIVCLQELFSGTYFCHEENYRYFDWAEPLDGVTVTRFAKLAADLKLTMIIPFFERRAAGVYHNSAVIAGPDGSQLGFYRKMHIPDDPGYYEKFYFTPGDLGFKAFDTPHGRIAVLICWDQWYPEGARLACLDGAEMLFYPTAIGWNQGEPQLRDKHAQAWQISMRGHAVSNGAYVCAVNRVGAEPMVEFWGRSFISDPYGQIIVEASNHEEQNLVTTVELGQVERTRQEWPFFRDRRIDAFGGIAQRFLR